MPSADDDCLLAFDACSMHDFLSNLKGWEVWCAKLLEIISAQAKRPSCTRE